ALAPGVRTLAVPLSGIAIELGHPVVKNVVALGALQAATGLLPAEALLATLREALARKGSVLALNEEAFRRGQRAAAGG
ncbi:MAG TPA: 2-oxoacid:acceptor oxidoreductase family protein, partial [Anaeromyxobacter sp.]|nr:2-oxoacid:acceptor oxidoreductase family protein [Anaeromyxobacter sp.]